MTTSRSNTKIASSYQFPFERFGIHTDATLEEGAKHLSSYLHSILTTEDSHPGTAEMAERAQNSETLHGIIDACKNVDIMALEQLEEKYLLGPKFNELVTAIQMTVESGGRIYVAGCGASGRVALSLRKLLPELFKDKIIPVIAGGDFALVRAIERFEDQGDYGIKQLAEQGFNPSQDLYLGISASGSATFINYPIAEQAKRVKEKGVPIFLKPWLICCNEASQLTTVLKQPSELAGSEKTSHPLIDYPEEVQCLGLNVGPNALAGSSRMQSASVTEIALYFALFQALTQNSQLNIREELRVLIEKLQTNAIAEQLAPLIIAEAACYEGEAMRYMNYRTDSSLAITVFTDLTERSPTFNLPKIENNFIAQEINREQHAWCSLEIEDIHHAECTFSAMLGCEPFSLNWEGEPLTASEKLNGFNFAMGTKEKREALTHRAHDLMLISRIHDELVMTYLNEKAQTKVEARFNMAGLSEFSQQMFLKMVLNIHSTLVMGRMKRYKNNLMTHLSVGNAKLFARSVRLTTQSIIGQLQEKNLTLFSRLMKTPGVPVNHAIQAVATTVAHIKLKEPSSASIVDSSTKKFFEKSGIVTANLNDLLEMQQVATQGIDFDENQRDKQYTNPWHKERREKLEAFFKCRQQLSSSVIEKIVPKLA